MEQKLLDLFTDYSEIIVDHFFEDNNELFKEIPLVKTINSIIQFKSSLDEKIFIKKISNFVNCLKDIPQGKKCEMILKVDNSGRYKQKVGEKLVEILNRIESDLKPTIIGNLFKRFVEEEITYEYFLRISYIVENSFNLDLLLIKDHDNEGNLYSEDANLIMSSMLFETGIGYFENEPTPKPVGEVTEIGKMIVKNME